MLDLYLLNETFTNGSNHALLTFVSIASAINGFFVIVSKNTFVCVIFLSIAGLFFIILLATQVGDYEQGVKQDAKHMLDEKEKKRGVEVDLVHCPHFNVNREISVNKQFVWDKNDPSGTRLTALFFPATVQSMYGYTGIVVTQTSDSWDPQNRVIKPKCPTDRFAAMAANGDIILSNGKGITFTQTPTALSLVRLNIQENA